MCCWVLFVVIIRNLPFEVEVVSVARGAASHINIDGRVALHALILVEGIWVVWQ